jgi:hypothetical protein
MKQKSSLRKILQFVSQALTTSSSNEFAAHRLFRLYTNQRFVANLGQRTLSKRGCRTADSKEYEQ